MSQTEELNGFCQALAPLLERRGLRLITLQHWEQAGWLNSVVVDGVERIVYGSSGCVTLVQPGAERLLAETEAALLRYTAPEWRFDSVGFALQRRGDHYTAQFRLLALQAPNYMHPVARRFCQTQ